MKKVCIQAGLVERRARAVVMPPELAADAHAKARAFVGMCFVMPEVAESLLAPPVSDRLKNCDLVRLSSVNRFYRKETREALDVRLTYWRRRIWLMKCTGYGELFQKEENRAVWTMTAPMRFVREWDFELYACIFDGERRIKFTQESWQNLLIEVDDQREFLDVEPRRIWNLRMRLWVKLVPEDDSPDGDVIVRKEYLRVYETKSFPIDHNGFYEADHSGTYQTRKMSRVRMIMEGIKEAREKYAVSYDYGDL